MLQTRPLPAGLAKSSGSSRDSASTWAASASWAVNSAATCAAVCGEIPLPRISPPVRPTPRPASPATLAGPGRAATSHCLADSTPTHIRRSAIDTAPATRPAGPAVNMGHAPWWPATDTIPSFAPSTAARSQLSRLDNPALWGSTAWRESRFRAASPVPPDKIRSGGKLRTVGNIRLPTRPRTVPLAS